MRIAVTGHRPDKLNNEYDIGPLSKKIYSELIKVIQRNKDCVCISGMALGVDTIWALAAIKEGRKLIAAIPFEGQEKGWPFKSQQVYGGILQYVNIEKNIISPPGYSAYKMQVRNEWMVNNCDGLIAVWDGTPGGTANCVRYAKTQGTKILYINPCTL